MTIFFYKYTKLYSIKELRDDIIQIIQLIISFLYSHKNFPLNNREKSLFHFQCSVLNLDDAEVSKIAVQHSITL